MSDRVTLPVNAPRAELTSPVGAGTSGPEPITDRTWIVDASGRAPAPSDDQRDADRNESDAGDDC